MNVKFVTCVIAAALGVTACRKAPVPTGSGQTAVPAATAGGQPGAPGTPGHAQAPAPPKPVPAELPNVVARVNGEEVKKADFERMIHSIEARAGQPMPPDRRDEIMRGALDQLLVYTLLSQESRNRQIKVDEAEIDARIREFQRPFQNPAAFTKALNDRGMTLDSLKHDTRVDLSVSKLLETETANQPVVSDQEARDFYDKNPDKFKQDEEVRASHVLIRVDEKADAAAKKKARAQIENVLKLARSRRDFAKLAQEHSQDGSAAQGGDLGFFDHAKMVAPFADAAFKLKPGQISGIVQTQFGYHVIKVTERRPARTLSYDEVSAQLKQGLGEERKGERQTAFIDGLRKKSKIEVLI